jgi:N-acetylglucosamine kinase-like BadF-type ATPase
VTESSVTRSGVTTTASRELHPPHALEGLFLGVDAGGTKTVALLADGSGRVVGSGRAGPCNIYDSVALGLKALDAAVGAALETAGVRLEVVRATCLSATGADWPEDFALFQSSLRARGYHRAHVVNDAMGALRAGSPDGTGVVVVCGTSAGIGAKAPDGRAWHSSFWQEPEGAEQLGRAALRAVYRAELGLDPPTSLTPRLLEHHGFPGVEAMLHAYTAREQRGAQSVGRLARVLLDAAAGGDATALRITLEHGRSLGDYALVAAGKVGLLEASFALVTAGGVMRHPSRLMAEALLARVHEAAPGANLVHCPLEPVAGAVFLAMETAGATVTEAVRDTLTASLPGAALFHT